MNSVIVAAITLQFRAMNHARIPIRRGEVEHAVGHFLFRQCDPTLSAQLHNEPGYRPFTISSIPSGRRQGDFLEFRPGQRYFLRITCFDGGSLWAALLTRFQTGKPLFVRLGALKLRLEALFSSPQTDPTGLACSTDWSLLASLPHRPYVTFYFMSPTAFSLGRRRFGLFPEPLLVWESLLRVWNTYAPLSFRMDRHLLRTAILRSVHVIACNLFTETLHFSTYRQKGFRGTCSYQIAAPTDSGQTLTTLAEFAQFAGVGYKTTMGMGQVRVEFHSHFHAFTSLEEEGVHL